MVGDAPELLPPNCSRTAQLLSSRRHPDALESLLHWFTVTRRATWEHLASVRADFPHADPVDGLTVFNIGGNKYRLVAVIKYRWKMVYIRHILTHAEYDRGNWKP